MFVASNVRRRFGLYSISIPYGHLVHEYCVMRRIHWRSAATCCRSVRQPLPSSTRRLCIAVETAPSSQLQDMETFRKLAFLPEKPFQYKEDAFRGAQRSPASQKWFSKPADGGSMELSQQLDEHLTWPFPFEIASPDTSGSPAISDFMEWIMQSADPTDQMLAGMLHASVGDPSSRTFFQLFAPLKLLKKALEFNRSRFKEHRAPLMLYIAQSSLDDLPPALQADLPTPQLVKEAGKGDVYNSSIWLGTEPTYTPLHRDPNPNLFSQLAREKVVRLLPPELGDRVFFDVQVQIRQQESDGVGSSSSSNSRIRSAEMMQGAERAILHEVVWSNQKLEDQMYEARLNVGDCLFIPQGWWHSVKSVGSEGFLNASVNWWFR